MKDIGCVNPSGCAKEFNGLCHSSRDCDYQRIYIKCPYCHWRHEYTGVVLDYCPNCRKKDYAATLPVEEIVEPF